MGSRKPHGAVPLGICGAKAKSRGGEPCQAKVPEGKRCWNHGGAPGSGRPIVHGRYSEVLKGAIREGYMASRTDPRLFDLTETMAAMDGMLKATAARLQEGDTPNFRARALELVDAMIAHKGQPDGEAGKALQALIAHIRHGVSTDEGEAVLLSRFERLSKRSEEANRILHAKQNAMPYERVVELLTALLAMLPSVLERTRAQSPADQAQAIADALWKHVEGTTNGPVRALETVSGRLN